MHDVWTFAVVWSFAVTAALALPMSAAILRALVSGREQPEERRARQLYRMLLEEEIVGGERCFSCSRPVEPDWLGCPTCAAQLHERCDCGALLELYWSVCPWCTSPQPRAEGISEADSLSVAA